MTGRTIGYARVSTAAQDLQLQLDALAAVRMRAGVHRPQEHKPRLSSLICSPYGTVPIGALLRAEATSGAS